MADVRLELRHGGGRAQARHVGNDALARLGDVFFQAVEFERRHQAPVPERGVFEPGESPRLKLSAA